MVKIMDVQTLKERLDHIIKSDKKQIAKVQRDQEYLIRLLKRSNLTTSIKIKVNQCLKKLDNLIQKSKKRMDTIESKRDNLTNLLDQSNLKTSRRQVLILLDDIIDELGAFQKDLRDEFVILVLKEDEIQALEELDNLNSY